MPIGIVVFGVEDNHNICFSNLDIDLCAPDDARRTLAATEIIKNNLNKNYEASPPSNISPRLVEVLIQIFIKCIDG